MNSAHTWLLSLQYKTSLLLHSMQRFNSVDSYSEGLISYLNSILLYLWDYLLILLYSRVSRSRHALGLPIKSSYLCPPLLLSCFLMYSVKITPNLFQVSLKCISYCRLLPMGKRIIPCSSRLLCLLKD